MRKKSDLQFEDFAPDIISAGELDYMELPLNTRVFFLIGLATLVVSLIAFGRVVYLNIGKGGFYQTRAAANVNKEKIVPAHRGLITDRFGAVLAKNTETFSVFMNVSELLKNRQQFNEVITKLSESLDILVSDLVFAISQTDFEKNTEVPIARNISPEVAISLRGLALPSVFVENDFRREYPMGSAFSSVLGYTGLSETGSTVIGKAGLERYYDSELRGVDGSYIYTRDVTGNVLDERIGTASEPGKKIETTIDGELQQYMYERLKQGLINLGLKKAVGIALDTRNGEILALVSLPTYDNNIFVTPGKSSERMEVINGSNQPLFNRVISGSYNPGSTIKPLVALSALHEGVIDPETQIYSKGFIEIPNPYVPDQPSRFVEFNTRELGLINVRGALAKSSNIFFYIAGGGFPAQGGQAEIKGLGIDRLRHYWEKFGLGSATGVDMESDSAGFLPSANEKKERTGQPWRLGDTYNVSIGQGDLLISPLQLINFIASVANDGVMYRPHLARSISDGAPLIPEVRIDYSDWKEELAEVQAGLRDGVRKAYGTANLLSDIPMAIAAKTGSAQIAYNTKTNAFFVGYAPYDNPKIAILILIENAKEGSLNALPIAKEIMYWYYLNRVIANNAN